MYKENMCGINFCTQQDSVDNECNARRLYGFNLFGGSENHIYGVCSLALETTMSFTDIKTPTELSCCLLK